MATVKIILTQTVPKLGTVGSVKEVAAGYARNFLLATNKAVLATPSTLSQVEKNQARLAKEGEIRYQLFQKEIDKLKDVILEIPAKVNKEGHLYGSIQAEDIADLLLKKYKLAVDSAWIKLPETTIKSTGEYLIKISFDNKEDKKDPTIKIIVSGEEEEK